MEIYNYGIFKLKMALDKNITILRGIEPLVKAAKVLAVSDLDT